MEPGRAWPIQVSPVKEILALGYMLEELKAFLEKGVDLKSLPPQAIGDLLLDPTASSDRANVPPFSLPIFQKFLVNFIIADDQSLNVIECKEFHRLVLLLRDDLKDSNIPHRTKIQSNIIQAWKDYFAILKIDLVWICKYWGQEWITCAEDIVLALMEKYRAMKVSASGNIESLSQPDSLDSLARLYGLDDMELGPSTCSALQAVEQEYRLYVDGELVDESMDPLRFWEVNHTQFPMMFTIAMDYLPIQASSVPCERVFSSSADTDMKKRNWISPILMEALQMLRYHLRSQQINFLANWTSPYTILVEDEPEELDDAGKKWKGDADIHTTLQVLLDRSEAEEGEALPSNVNVYA
ncbi:hypothetical protein PISMIDRAFT_16959 [Pisolithus microcarpus 441]|uniref:HAT C-terminal dimerisation domain-containing protein n=1 Tax=Pisolithus microcarpus 441 TaxID=765257 RepID=A0A0C9Z4E3_9AGAM|nr:hypothetical protein PISMIDRAFT_16959 [Pisolithus microcarpus 441]